MEVGFHEPGLILMKIDRNIFMSVYRIDPCGLRVREDRFLTLGINQANKEKNQPSQKDK